MLAIHWSEPSRSGRPGYQFICLHFQSRGESWASGRRLPLGLRGSLSSPLPSHPMHIVPDAIAGTLARATGAPMFAVTSVTTRTVQKSAPHWRYSHERKRPKLQPRHLARGQTFYTGLKSPRRRTSSRRLGTILAQQTGYPDQKRGMPLGGSRLSTA